MKKAAEFIKENLLLYDGVSDVKDNLPVGKREVSFLVTEKGKSLGFDTRYVSKKIRENFDGVLTSNFLEEEEVELIIRTDPKTISMASMKSFLIKSPKGILVPLGEIVNISKKQDFSVIKRRNGFREISITAEINEDIFNPDYFFKNFKKILVLSQIKDNYNLDWKLAGRSEEQAETFGDMKRGSFLALGVIFIILAFIFQSYLLPICIMSINPFYINRCNNRSLGY